MSSPLHQNQQVISQVVIIHPLGTSSRDPGRIVKNLKNIFIKTKNRQRGRQTDRQKTHRHTDRHRDIDRPMDRCRRQADRGDDRQADSYWISSINILLTFLAILPFPLSKDVLIT